MCNFFSLIMLKNGDVIWEAGVDSHEDLIAKVPSLKDDTADPKKLRFARVEITPPNADVFEKDLKKWQLRIDQSITPAWWDTDCQKACYTALKACLAEVIIDGQEIGALENKNGLWIRDSQIKILTNSQVRVLRDNSQVGELMENSQVRVLWGNSQVGELRDNSQVRVLMDNSQVGVLRDNSQVRVLWGNSQVGELRDNSQVGVLWGNSQVGELRDNSQVRVLRDNSQVRVLWGNSQVGELRGNSQVGELRDNSQVRVLMDNSQVGVLMENSLLCAVRSSDCKFKIKDGSNGLAILHYKDNLEIVSAADFKGKLTKIKKEKDQK